MSQTMPSRSTSNKATIVVTIRNKEMALTLTEAHFVMEQLSAAIEKDRQEYLVRRFAECAKCSCLFSEAGAASFGRIC